ncbi:hypothetical protein [Tissierella praeacuta]|uniref:hypothetical protein n=1 Tax=Tissierella praeacuta TaxID=43131 RepID=UPI003340C56E
MSKQITTIPARQGQFDKRLKVATYAVSVQSLKSTTLRKSMITLIRILPAFTLNRNQAPK